MTAATVHLAVTATLERAAVSTHRVVTTTMPEVTVIYLVLLESSVLPEQQILLSVSPVMVLASTAVPGLPTVALLVLVQSRMVIGAVSSTVRSTHTV